jgi:glycine oxidase
VRGTRCSRVAVVGAGVGGLATAVELVRAGFEVEVFEQAEPGSGSTCGAMGTITPFSDHDADHNTLRLAAENSIHLRVLVKELEQSLGWNCGFRECGTLELHFEPHERAPLLARAEVIVESGHEAIYLDRSETLKLEPAINPSVGGAVYYPAEPELSPARMIQGLTEYLKSRGGAIHRNTRVFSVQESREEVRIEHEHGITTFGLAVVAAGLDHNMIGGLPSLQLEAITGEVIDGTLPDGVSIQHNLYYGRGFIAPKVAGNVLLGANYDLHPPGAPKSRDSCRLQSLLDTLSATVRILPCAEAMEINRFWRNWRPRGPNGRPIIRRVGQKVLILNGLYGLGFTLSFAFAHGIAQYFRDSSAGFPFAHLE